ncbi:nephrin-like [Pecten maximus]|uniref:nephrin-like n=1 Tax=Pecten maximus TaxID=6579 RepID=UPI0014583BF9|nr:nephrin-like [Pecten maximus]
MSEYDLDMSFVVDDFSEYCRQEDGFQQYQFEPLRKLNLSELDSENDRLVPPTILDLISKTENGNLTEGSSISLVCSVESFPPAKIQWFYKANNTVLLTTPDVLESTYTLTNADCLDTGLYTCSVRNSVSTTAVTRDIPINVLCKPREDSRVIGNHNFGLALSENLTVTAKFLTNPMPSFTWSFQNASSEKTEELVSGAHNFGTHNFYFMTNLSAVSVGIRTNMQEHWYGTYTVTATNSQGSGRISFIVEAQGKPNPPYEGAVICPGPDQAILSWKSAFDGGSTQTFAVGKKSQTQDIFVIDRILDTPDPGQHRTANISISGLAAGTQHFFVVFAVNRFGNSSIEREVNCTTKSLPVPEASPLGPILGAAGGSAAAVIVVIIVVIIVVTKKRKSGKNKRDDDIEMIPEEISPGGSSDGLKRNILYESSDGLKANILYETSDPQPGTSSEYAVVQKKSKSKPVSPDAEYAVVDKTKKETSKPTNDVYAEVVKPAGKGGKDKRKKGGKKTKGSGEETKIRKKPVANAENVYEKVEDIDGASGNIYANCQDGATLALYKGPTRKRNQDGLIYLDVEFKEEKENGRNYVIHGIENRTDYADVDFTKRADPLPPDSEDPKQP